MIESTVQIHQLFMREAANMKRDKNKIFYITPMHFKDLITQINDFIQSFSETNSQQIERYEKGVAKLNSTENEIVNLRSSIESLTKRLEILSSQNAKLLEQLEGKQKEADSKKYNCQKE